MARVKRCDEEFNPWPPFVDVFSSVILVLLLFILVTIVNVAYYMQFNSKVDSKATTKSNMNNLQAGTESTDLIALNKMLAPKLDSQGNDALFSGGKSTGNAVSMAQKEEKPKDQSIKSTPGKELLIAYNDKEIFMQKNAASALKSFIKDVKSKNKNAKFEISVAQPINLVSATIKKQISIARLLGTKNSIKKLDVKLSDMKLNMQYTKDDNYQNGYIKVKVLE